MIIVRLIGGLGNQLFQYAVGRCLAEKNSAVLKIDISPFATYKLHKYSLWAFNIQENFASPDEVTALMVLKQGIAEQVVNRLLYRPTKLSSNFISEKHFYFDPQVLKLQGDIYLSGYWQSEKYFKNIEGLLRREFTVKTQIMGKNKELNNMIISCESVSIHIRRGDFVSNLKTNQTHGVCNLDYYNKCIEKIKLSINNPHFFIFSDDCEWAMVNLKINDQLIIVDHNGPDKNYEDLRLMMHCKHHIIANSSFSWWGAWLNPNPDKIVIAPKQWFADEKMNSQTKDLIPEGWIRL